MIVFAGLVALTFFLPRLMPGDPVELLLSADVVRALTPDEIEKLRRQFGLGGSWFEQFIHYLTTLAKGDLGFSLRHARPVLNLLLHAVPWTALLILGAMPVYFLLGLWTGIVSGEQPHSARDRIVTGAMILVASIPPFAAAIFLLLGFGVIWPILPISGAEPLFPPASSMGRVAAILRHAILPAAALALHEVARFFFLARGEAVILSARPFILNARARGLRGWRLHLHYYGRNILPMALARMSDSITTLFGAVFFVEVVFSYPGIGSLIYNAMLERDYILLQGAMLGLALVVLSLNWILDALVTRLVARG
ncbi:ABC transporter permease [Sinirhodobacter populi]|uniref:ABC transporter permease n=1 Tax=Paenirhodobacter populi TaxID=2306993 RepID=A0A443KH55_9RHOB|nr:ABC transporter permease [Sinirhodobacter populi]